MSQRTTRIYKYKGIKLNLGLILPVYLFLWPFLSMLVQVDSLSFYINSKFLLIDFRLLFYLLSLIACIFKLIRPGDKISKRKITSLFLLGFFAFLFLLSFLVNINLVAGDYKQFINGFLSFSILSAYTILYSDSINWNLVAKLYALSLALISLFGFYAFFRFYRVFGIQIIYGPLSQQLFRLAGGKAFWLPSVLILAFIFFEFKSKNINSNIVNVSLLISNLLLLVSSQRNAITVIAYELIIFFIFVLKRKIFFILVLLGIMLIFFADKIFFLLKLTLFKRLQLESSYDGGRLKIWEATLNALTSDIRHIIFGVSEGGLPFISGSKWPLVDSDNPHNILLYFWATTGITGLTLLISLILLCGYAIYKKNKLHQIIFYCLFVNSLVFAGFGFYENYSKTDFLNIGIVVAFSIIFRKQDAKVRDTASALNPDSSRLNERYS